MLAAALLVGCSSDDGGTVDGSTDGVASDHASDDALDAGLDVVDATFDRAPFPQVPLIGKTMHAPTLVTIVASNDDELTVLPGFSDAFPQSKLWTSMAAEYALGSITSAAQIAGPSMSGSYSSAQIASYVAAAIAGNASIAPNGNTIYLVYLPSAATISGSFAADCGYHTSYPTTGSLGDQMAIVQRCAPVAPETTLDLLTIIASHEIAESATDPLGNGYTLGKMSATPWTTSVWHALAGVGQIELGDLCEGTRIFEAVDGGPVGGWAYQRIWSNAGAASGADPCTPASPDPYESSTTPTDWYTATAGAPVTIPLEGWSVTPTNPWLLYAKWTTGTTAFTSIAPSSIAITTSLGNGVTGACAPREAMNTGMTGTVTVDVPTTATSGDFGVLWLYNFREGPGCEAPLSQDEYHFWLVGIHVP
jgi:hypothetical protein